MSKSSAKPTATLSTLERIGDRTMVRGKLALLGWSSMAAWATAHGYDRQLVAWAVMHWGNRTDKEPHGGLCRQAMRELRATLAQQITPAMHQAAAAGDFDRV